MTPDVTELRLNLRAAGFSPVPCEGKRPPMEKWPEQLNASEDEIRLWANAWHLAHNTGIIAKFTPGLDIDILDEDAAEAMEHLAREHFGNITTRIGLWPKRLIPLRTDEPFKKLKRAFRAPDGAEHKIEVLCDGQQWVAFGEHPDTGMPYRWPNGAPGNGLIRDKLPLVRLEDIEKFLDAAETLLIDQHDFTLVTGLTEANGAGPHQSGGEPLAPTSRVAAAVRVIPNNNLDWDDWNRVGMAIWAATNGSAEGFEVFDKWSQKSSKYDGRTTSKKWSKLTKCPPDSIGFGTLKFLADQADPRWGDVLLVDPPEPEPGDPGAEPGPKPAPATIPAVIAEWNEHHAHVLAGSKSNVLQEFTTAEGYIDFKLLSSAAFHEWYAEYKIQVGTTEDGEPVFMPVSKYWLRHPQRRKYGDIGFFPGGIPLGMPGYYNLWRGFAVEPRKGKCSRFLAHLRDNVCQGDGELYDWVIAWFAAIFKYPGSKCGTALALRGKQGVGKTKVGEVFGSLLGVHFKPVSDPRYITGRFNSHLVSLLLLHADEGFWAGDRKAEGKLKDLITGKSHPIEFKGQEPFWINNFVRLFVTGNPDWVVPAAFEERRFAVLDVGTHHQRDYKYFKAIDAEMNNGGREALLYHLLYEVDCSKVNLREIPHTAALVEQKLESATTEQGWWLDILSAGILPGDKLGDGETPSEVLFNHYIEAAKRKGAPRRAIEVQLGVFLRKVVESLEKTRKTYELSGPPYCAPDETIKRRGMVYQFPSLQACRDQFTTQVNDRVDWGEDDDLVSSWSPEKE